ncbi:NUDIX hydrolase [Chengkuizengella marina]|uniref:NUDIX hydrolase n=1 Tax=Chengkuizengella marina TaxID=2507566 RepID=A0A6N9PXL2_9BACL|nr:NUDIX hydrolase [Chengkuizengella marina]NBI27646.1 NUDIX hydrolase [Chengkuizengella marina]
MRHKPSKEEFNKKFEEVTLDTEQIFKGKIISLQVDKVKLPNGNISTREIVRHPGAVAVLAIYNDKMIVVEQYRKPLEKNQIEIPAGKLDPGEEPKEAAIRELKEETGFDCGSIKQINSFFTSPGFADEKIVLFFAEDLIRGEMELDEDEFLSCESITLEQALEYIKEEKISDAKTITAVYAWQIYKLTGKI